MVNKRFRGATFPRWPSDRFLNSGEIIARLAASIFIKFLGEKIVGGYLPIIGATILFSSILTSNLYIIIPALVVFGYLQQLYFCCDTPSNQSNNRTDFFNSIKFINPWLLRIYFWPCYSRLYS